jgi:hypothetical protein
MSKGRYPRQDNGPYAVTARALLTMPKGHACSVAGVEVTRCEDEQIFDSLQGKVRYRPCWSVAGCDPMLLCMAVDAVMKLASRVKPAEVDEPAEVDDYPPELDGHYGQSLDLF